jgi:hypothetical protein
MLLARCVGAGYHNNKRPRITRSSNMGQTVNVNPTSEHAVYLRLFITNGGGW